MEKLVSTDDGARDHRIEALKVLMRVLLSEVDALGGPAAFDSAGSIDLSEEVRRYEAELIRSALIRTGGRQRRAARLLNVKIATLNAKIKRYHLDTDELVAKASDLLRNGGKGSYLH